LAASPTVLPRTWEWAAAAASVVVGSAAGFGWFSDARTFFQDPLFAPPIPSWTALYRSTVTHHLGQNAEHFHGKFDRNDERPFNAAVTLSLNSTIVFFVVGCSVVPTRLAFLGDT
jgi:hypothetical protein